MPDARLARTREGYEGYQYQPPKQEDSPFLKELLIGKLDWSRQAQWKRFCAAYEKYSQVT